MIHARIKLGKVARFICVCWSTLLVTLGTGCRVVQYRRHVPGKAVHAVTPGSPTKQPEADPVEVQQTLMRFSDEYLVSMVYGHGASSVAAPMRWIPPNC